MLAVLSDTSSRVELGVLLISRTIARLAGAVLLGSCGIIIAYIVLKVDDA